MSIGIDLLKKIARDGSVRIEEVQAIEVVLSRRQRCQQQLREESERHERAVAQINQQLRAAQKSCPHTAVTYFPDASGNNDSSTICDICCAEVRTQSDGMVVAE